MFKKLAAASLICLLLSTQCYAGTISYTALSSDAGVSYNHLNDSFTTIYNSHNGNIEDVNLAADTLTERVFSDGANPRVRDYEIVGDWTYTGMLPATDTDLTSDISAGTSYVLGYRIVKDATAHTYTASKDTWVYIDYNSAYQFEEVANGASQPTTPANSLLLAKVVTNGTAITSVSDQRQTTPPNLRIYTDLISGCVISRDTSTATKVTIDRGEIELGSTNKVRRNTSAVTVDFTATGRGGLDTGSLAAGTYYYIHALADDDNAVNFEGIASLSATDATGVTGERLIGWCYATATNTISVDAVGGYRGVNGEVPNTYGASKDGMSFAISAKTAIMLHRARFYSSGRPVLVSYQITATSSGATRFKGEISADAIQIPGTFVGHSLDNLGDSYSSVSSQAIYKNMAAGTHYLDLTVTADDSSTGITVKSWSITIQEL